MVERLDGDCVEVEGVCSEPTEPSEEPEELDEGPEEPEEDGPNQSTRSFRFFSSCLGGREGVVGGGRSLMFNGPVMIFLAINQSNSHIEYHCLTTERETHLLVHNGTPTRSFSYQCFEWYTTASLRLDELLPNQPSPHGLSLRPFRG
jgi:hypothetical protein